MHRLCVEWFVASVVIACVSDVRTLRNMPLVITSSTLHFMDHIRSISICELLCFSFLSASVSMILLSASIKMHVFSLCFKLVYLAYLTQLICLWIGRVISSSSHTGFVCVCVCVRACLYHMSVVSVPSTLQN